MTVPPTRSYFQFYSTHDGNGLSLTTLYRTLMVDMTSIVLRLFRSYPLESNNGPCPRTLPGTLLRTPPPDPIPLHTTTTPANASTICISPPLYKETRTYPLRNLAILIHVFFFLFFGWEGGCCRGLAFHYKRNSRSVHRSKRGSGGGFWVGDDVEQSRSHGLFFLNCSASTLQPIGTIP